MSRFVTLCVVGFMFFTLLSCSSPECPLNQGMKGAEFEVKDIENGSVITITSDDPGKVAEIQKHCKQVVAAPKMAGILPCGKCPGSKKCWDKKEVKTE
jgi:TusA-related sulfurtransferase